MYNIYMQISELSYNLLKTTIYTLSAELKNLEKLVPQPLVSKLSKNPVQNFYLGLNYSPSSSTQDVCTGVYIENCENIHYSSDTGNICKNYYMQWNYDGMYCNKYFRCKEKTNQYNDAETLTCGIDLDTSCNMSDVSGVWRQFL